jgi:hypothetical protein
MIRSQRRRHLWIWLILGPLILLGFALGLSARRPAPVQDAGVNKVATGATAGVSAGMTPGVTPGITPGAGAGVTP